jgi:predicted RNA-binding protein with PIN domain
VLFVVDGMNVIGAQPDGWWRDRAAARRRLVDDVAPLIGDGTEVTVVFDGRPGVGEGDGAAAVGMEVRFAPGGPNAADDVIVEMVRTLSRPGDTVVVTSDRALADRVRRLGVTVEGTRAFRARLARPEPA